MFVTESNEDEVSIADGDDTAESDEIELNLLPVDFDMSAVKASLLEFSRVEGIRAINRKAIESIVKKVSFTSNLSDTILRW